MAASVIAGPIVFAVTNNNTITISFTTVAGGSPWLIVCVNERVSNITNIRFNGVDMINAADFTGGRNHSIWYLPNPFIGVANVVVNFGVTVDHGLYAIELGNVRAVGNSQGAQVASGNLSLTVTGVVLGDMILDIAETSVADTLTAGADQTQNMNSAGASDTVAGSRQTTIDGVMSWTVTGPANSGSSLAVNFQGGGGGTRMIIMNMKRFMDDLKAGLIPPKELQRRYHDLVSI